MGLPTFFSNGTECLVWLQAEAHVRTLTTPEIEGELACVLDALPEADAMDRANNTTRGGLYRDMCSVYRTELHRRLTHGVVCPTCGR